MPHKSDPPSDGFDANGNPLWGKHQYEYCRGHDKYLPRGKFRGIEWVDYYCRECMAERYAEKKAKARKPEKNPLAYTHILRKQKGKKLYRFHILQTNGIIPDGYDIVFTVKPGELIPGFYREYDVYVNES